MSRLFPWMMAALALTGCAGMPVVGNAGHAGDACHTGMDCASPMAAAQAAAAHAARMPERAAVTRRQWLACATQAYRTLARSVGDDVTAPAALANHCSDHLLQALLAQHRQGWEDGVRQIAGVEMAVELRGLSPNLGRPLQLIRAAEVPVEQYAGQRYVQAGFGIPLVARSPRCSDHPVCALLPPEGITRNVTAWIEVDTRGQPRLVVADPSREPALLAGRLPLAWDSSAAYVWAVHASPLNRLGLWGLLGGQGVGHRAGVYLLEDYDPGKRPVVMIHGLGSSPLIWAKLSSAVWGDPQLREHFQVWHVVYQTNAPLLFTRRRVQGYLDAAWRTLDPGDDDPARKGMVLVGHSMGGVLARLLSADSGDVLWSAAFDVPPEALRGSADDLDVVRGSFLFSHYPGVERAIFMAAPHHGSPTADGWMGRLMNNLVGRRAPEMQALRRLTSAQPAAVREELRESYLHSRLNSIATLRMAQPVSRAGQSLLPATGIPYHTIAGRLPGTQPPGDGAVPLDSAVLPGATSILVVESGHDIYQRDEAVREVLRILREDAATQPSRTH